MASRAREGCQPVRQTVLFLILLLQNMGPLGTFLVASRKHRPHHSIHLYTPRPDYISQRPLLIHTTHKNKALASDTTKLYSLHPTSYISLLLLRLMASRAREGYCQPVVRQTVVLFLVLLQKISPPDKFLVASRKHRPHPIYRSLQAPPVPARASLS